MKTIIQNSRGYLEMVWWSAMNQCKKWPYSNSTLSSSRLSFLFISQYLLNSIHHLIHCVSFTNSFTSSIYWLHEWDWQWFVTTKIIIKIINNDDNRIILNDNQLHSSRINTIIYILYIYNINNNKSTKFVWERVCWLFFTLIV